MRGSWIGEFNKDVETLLLNAIENQTPAQTHCYVALMQASGAIHDKDVNETAFPHRKE